MSRLAVDMARALDPAALAEAVADATGCGLPVADHLRERSGIPDGHLMAVMFTAGESVIVHLGAGRNRGQSASGQPPAGRPRLRTHPCLW